MCSCVNASVFKLHKRMRQLLLHNEITGTKSRFQPKRKHTVEYLNTGLKGWRHAAQRRAGDELIAYFSERVWWRWMPPLATRIHTSVIHLATSHRTDPLSHVLSHLAPRHSTLHVLSVRYVSPSLSFFSRRTPNTPRADQPYHCLDKARKQRKVYLGTDCYNWLEKGLRDMLFIHVGRKEARVQLCDG